MSTTTIRLEDELKARVAAAAERAGTTAHAFILEAIAQTVEQAELEEEFHGIADQRRQASSQTDCTTAEALTPRMARIELAPEVLGDFDRIVDHLVRFDAEDVPERTRDIVEAIQVLTHSPLIGRKVKGGKRELVIGQGSRGYVALYRYLSEIDVVFVLAIRGQRESGYKGRR
jgi:toxin ParE1/3/4